MTVESITALAPALFGSGLLSLVFAYLWWIYREPAIGWWTLAWVLWSVRRIWALLANSMMFESPPLALVGLVFSYLTLMLVGTATFTGRRIGPVWYLIAVGALIAVAVSPADGPAPTLVTTAVVAIAWGWGASMFFRSDPAWGTVRWIPGIAMALMSVATLRIPIVGDDPVRTALGTAAVFGIQMLIAVGMLLIYSRRERERLIHAHVELDRALRRALDEHLPVCGGCRRVQSAGYWTTLESYLGTRREVRVSHGICPTCMKVLYPEFAPDDPAPGGREG